MTDPVAVERFIGPAGEFHARAVPSPASRSLWVHEITRPAVVLGSTQRDELVDAGAAADAGVDVVRRRSGGGAVWLAPDEVAWIDVVVPAGSPGWGSDVHTPMRWLGRRLVAAFAAADPALDPHAHEGSMSATQWSSIVCFDGLGPGEVVVGEAKLVGISQRRTRDAARLQCCWYHRHEHRDLVDLLRVDHRPPLADLRRVHTVPPSTTAAVLAALPALLSTPD